MLDWQNAELFINSTKYSHFQKIESQLKLESFQNVNISLVLKQFFILMSIFNMFENQYKFESFQDVNISFVL